MNPLDRTYLEPDSPRIDMKHPRRSATTIEQDTNATTIERPGAEATLFESTSSTPTGSTTLEGSAVAGSAHIRWVLPPALAADYELLQLISDSGAQADVFHARSRGDGTEKALKLYKTAHSMQSREANLVAGADPKHVVPTEFGQSDGQQWEIQEYMPLGTLAELPRTLHHQLTNAELTEVATELITALAHIHGMGLAHRDIKPSNVLVRTVSPLNLVLADFGLARNLVAGSQLGSAHRTQGYAAPEVLQDVQTLDSDWWSLGITLLELAMGRHPFSNTDGRWWNEAKIYSYLMSHEVEVSPVTDDRLRLLISGLLTKNRAHRWGPKEAIEWVDGGSPKVWEAAPSSTVAAQPREWAFAGFPTGSDSYTSTEELGRALGRHWSAAASYLAGRGSSTLHNALAKTDLADPVKSAFDRYRARIISEDAMLFELISILDPDSDPTFRGRPLTSQGLRAVATEAGGGDATAAAWITALRSERILENTDQYPNYKDFVAIDENLSRWWGDITAYQRDLPTAQRDYNSSSNLDTSNVPDLAEMIEAQRPLIEGQLLACALSPQELAVVHSKVPPVDAERSHAPWIGELAARAAAQSPPHPGLDLVVIILAIPARLDREAAEAEHNRRDAAELEARRRQQATDRTQQRKARISEANSGVYSAAAAAFAYFLIVGFGFGMSTWTGKDLDLTGFSTIPIQVAIGAAVAIAIRWAAGATLGSPQRWVGAVCIAIGFTIGWFGSGGGYWLPLVTAAIGYLLAAAVTRYAPVVTDPATFEAPVPRPLVRLMRWGFIISAVGVPLAVVQMVMSMSDTGTALVNQWVLDFHGSVWDWLATMLDWFGGMSRVQPRASALWAIPCFIALIAIVCMKRGGSRSSSGTGNRHQQQQESSTRSIAEGVVLAVVSLGMVSAIIYQWAIAVMVTGLLIFVAVILAVGTFIGSIFAS